MGLDLHVFFKNGLRIDPPHLFLTISHSCVSKIDSFCVSLSSARAKSNYLKGCPPEDPRDGIRALQEIPQSLTHNTPLPQVTPPWGHHVCIRMIDVNIVYSSNTVMGISLIHFKCQGDLLDTVYQCDIIGTLDVHHLAQRTNILFCLNEVFQNWPCEEKKNHPSLLRASASSCSRPVVR